MKTVTRVGECGRAPAPRPARRGPAAGPTPSSRRRSSSLDARCRRARSCTSRPLQEAIRAATMALELGRRRRSGSRRRPVSPGRGRRVVCETEKRRSRTAASTRARIVDFPAPDGADTTNRLGRAAHSTFCTCSRSRSISVLRATTSCTTGADRGLAADGVGLAAPAPGPGSRAACRRASLPPQRLARLAPRGCAAAATSSRDVGRSTSAHDLLVEPRVLEAQLLAQRRAPSRAACSRARAPRSGAVEASSMRGRRGLDGGQSAAQHASRSGAPSARAHRSRPVERLRRRRPAAPRRASLVQAGRPPTTSSAPGKRATSPTVTSPARPCSAWISRSARTSAGDDAARDAHADRRLVRAGAPAPTTSTRPRCTRSCTSALHVRLQRLQAAREVDAQVEEAVVEAAHGHGRRARASAPTAARAEAGHGAHGHSAGSSGANCSS